MEFPVVVHKDPKSDYGVTVPDLPGCYSAGRSLEEALAMAREAIELHLEGLASGGLQAPQPGRIEDYSKNYRPTDAIWTIVAIPGCTLRPN